MPRIAIKNLNASFFHVIVQGKNKSLNEIKQNKEMLKELIKYLKEKHGVTYVSIMKRLDISREKMNFLTKNDVF